LRAKRAWGDGVAPETFTALRADLYRCTCGVRVLEGQRDGHAARHGVERVTFVLDNSVPKLSLSYAERQALVRERRRRFQRTMMPERDIDDASARPDGDDGEMVTPVASEPDIKADMRKRVAVGDGADILADTNGPEEASEMENETTNGKATGEWIGASDVAALLGHAQVASAFRLGREGKLQTRKVGQRGVEFERASVERYLAEKAAGGGDRQKVEKPTQGRAPKTNRAIATKKEFGDVVPKISPSATYVAQVERDLVSLRMHLRVLYVALAFCALNIAALWAVR